MLPAEASETVPVPGATRSGFAPKSIFVGPDELKPAIVSSYRVSVPFVLEAPTVSTHGAFAGAVIPPYWSSRRVLAEVAGRAHDNDAAIGQRLGGERQGSVQSDSVMRGDQPTC